MNNSRAMLVDYAEPDEYYLDRYREREVRRTGKRVRRSQSDVTLHSTKRPKNRKQRGEAPFENQIKRVITKISVIIKNMDINKEVIVMIVC